MKIIRLQAENFKRIQAVEITPAGDLVVIGGSNAAGKTSCLDAIAMALGGGDVACEQPLRHGALKGKTVVELDDLIVTRKYTPNGTTLEVTSREGMKYPSPQAVLDALVGKLTFDPLAFARMKPKEQLEMLRQMTGLNFTLLDSRRASLFDDRTQVNREVKQAEAQLATMLPVLGVPEEEVSVAALTKQIEAANSRNTSNAEARNAVRGVLDQRDFIQRQVEGQEKSIADLRKQLAAAEEKLATIEHERDVLTTRYDALMEGVEMLDDSDTAPILAQIQSAEVTNRLIRGNKAYREARTKLAAKQHEAAALSAKIDEIDAKKRQRLAETEFPVEGLGLTYDVVLFNGVPFDQASGAEQLRVSVAIGMAANPKLKILLCRDGSLLDSKSLAMLAEIVQENGYQCWLERVGEGAEVGVVIEDGLVKEAK